MNLDEAYSRCLSMAAGHYENFPVASWLVPGRQRGAVAAIYAFARTADDFADEPLEALGLEGRPGGAPGGKAEERLRLKLLKDWEAKLDQPAREPVFLALHDAIRRFAIPKQLLRDLVSAFRQDVVKRRYRDFDEVLDYCRRSANPVGRLVLRLFDRDDERSVRESDHICTALQLANFWQDLGQDASGRDRLYLPLDEMKAHGVRVEDPGRLRFSPGLGRLVALQVERTRGMFRQGADLARRAPGRLGMELRLTWLGGMQVLRKVEAQGFDTLSRRPRLGKGDWALLSARCLLGRLA